MKFLEKLVSDLVDVCNTLDGGIDDKRDLYEITTTDVNGSRKRFVGRDEFLEIVMGSVVGNLYVIIDDIEEYQKTRSKIQLVDKKPTT